MATPYRNELAAALARAERLAQENRALRARLAVTESTWSFTVAGLRSGDWVLWSLVVAIALAIVGEVWIFAG